jgi:RNA polymerase sigma-70 factor, ECF subfamily
MTKNTCRLAARGLREARGRGGGRIGVTMNDDPRALQALRAAEVLEAMATLRVAARRWSADWVAAEDLLQDTLERALRTLDCYKPGTSAGAWMRTIMFRLAVDESRRRRRDRLVRAAYARQSSPRTEPLEHADEPAPPMPTAAQVSAAAGQLHEPFRTVYDLWANQRMSYLQISQALGVPVSTVATRLLRARRYLRSAFLGQSAGPPPHRVRSTRVRTRGPSGEPIAPLWKRLPQGAGALAVSASGRCRSPLT